MAVTFYWLALHRQVRIEGVAEKVSHEVSEKYFHERPRASQVSKFSFCFDKKHFIKLVSRLCVDWSTS